MPEPIIAPIDLIRHNAGRGAITGTHHRQIFLYSVKFSLTHDGQEDLHEIHFGAFDDRHASNKANLLLMVGIEGTDYEFDIISIISSDGDVVYDYGTCTCFEGCDQYCPTHGIGKTYTVEMITPEVFYGGIQPS